MPGQVPPHTDNTDTSTLGNLLAEQARRRPDANAIEEKGRPPLTFAALARHIDRTRRTLRELGIGRHDRVALILSEGSEAAVAHICIASAAVVVPLLPAYRPAKVAFFLQHMSARALVVAAGANPDTIAAARAAGIAIITLTSRDEAAGAFDLSCDRQDPPVLDADVTTADDVAVLLHTSGTTGRRKLVPLTHRNLCASARNNIAALRLGPLDRSLVLMPLFHVGGLVRALISALAAGGTVICTAGFQAGQFLDWLVDYEPTWYTASPAIQHAIVNEALRSAAPVRSTLRLIRAGAAPMPATLLNDLERVFGVPVITGYGMTEAAGHICSSPLPPAARKLGSVGIPTAPEVAILDERGSELGPREVGEIAIRGANVMTAYERDPETNAASFVNGWLRTGDQGYRDDDGYLYIAGRLKDIINRGGEKIAPWEVDEALQAHPSVAQAIAFPVPDTQLGEIVAAAVVLKPGVDTTAHELREFVAERLAFFKVPYRVVLLPELPRGSSGKVQRAGMAELLGLPDHVRSFSATACAPRTPVETELVRIWRAALRVPDVGVHDDFFELGGNSMTAVQVLLEIQHRLGTALRADVIFRKPTIARLAATIERSQGEASGRHGKGRRSLTATERRLVLIWRRVLGVRRVGLRDNFFDLGGSSEDAARLSAEVESVFGEGLPVRTLRDAPTIEGLARVLDGTTADLDLLVPLQPDGSRPPLFAIHAAAGYVFFYRALASRLGAEFPFYAVQAQGHVCGRRRPYAPAASVEQVARRYIGEIRRIQPLGPYNLAGASFGGVVAFEMARQLRADGEAVDTLFLFSPHIRNNPFAQGVRTPAMRDPVLKRAWLHLARYGLVETAGVVLRQARQSVRQRVTTTTSWLNGEGRWRALLHRPIPAELVNKRFLAASRALNARYRPGEYDGGAILFRAEKDEDPVPLWTGLMREGLEVYDTPGGHLEMLQEPTVEWVADLIRARLNSAYERQRSASRRFFRFSA